VLRASKSHSDRFRSSCRRRLFFTVTMATAEGQSLKVDLELAFQGIEPIERDSASERARSGRHRDPAVV